MIVSDIFNIDDRDPVLGLRMELKPAMVAKGYDEVLAYQSNDSNLFFTTVFRSKDHSTIMHIPGFDGSLEVTVPIPDFKPYTALSLDDSSLIILGERADKELELVGIKVQGMHPIVRTPVDLLESPIVNVDPNHINLYAVSSNRPLLFVFSGLNENGETMVSVGQFNRNTQSVFPVVTKPVNLDGSQLTITTVTDEDYPVVELEHVDKTGQTETLVFDLHKVLASLVKE